MFSARANSKVGLLSVREYRSMTECLPSIHEALGSASIMGEGGLARISLRNLNQENAYTVKDWRGKQLGLEGGVRVHYPQAEGFWRSESGFTWQTCF